VNVGREVTRAGVREPLPFTSAGTVSMNRKLAIGLAMTTLVVVACGDANQLLAPDAPDVVPSFSAQQQTDRVFAGRVLARLAPGADADAVAQANGVAFERQAAGGAFGIFRGAAGNKRALAARLGADVNVV